MYCVVWLSLACIILLIYWSYTFEIHCSWFWKFATPCNGRSGCLSCCKYSGFTFYLIFPLTLKWLNCNLIYIFLNRRRRSPCLKANLIRMVFYLIAHKNLSYLFFLYGLGAWGREVDGMIASNCLNGEAGSAPVPSAPATSWFSSSKSAKKVSVVTLFK